MKLICMLVGVVGRAFSVEINESQWICELKDAIKAKKPDTIKCNADKLQLFLAKKDGVWLESETDDVKKLKKGEKTVVIETLTHKDKELQGETGLQKVLMGMPQPSTDQIHVLVVVPTPNDKMTLDEIKQSNEKFIWLGKPRLGGEDEGINLSNEKTLLRNTVTDELIRRLDQYNIVLVKSPPMTGKTSMATLASRALVEKYDTRMEKAIIFNFSVLQLAELNGNFMDAFKMLFNVEWHDTTLTIPHQRIVYLIVDETQTIYQELGPLSPIIKASAFWHLVKGVISDMGSRVRILMFATYRPCVLYTKYISLSFTDPAILFGIEDLSFHHDEVVEYVKKCFIGVKCLENTENGESPAIERFCESLEQLTGCHIGLCVTAINELNRICHSRVRNCSSALTVDELIRKIQDGSLFRALIATRSVSTLDTLNDDELNWLERIFYGETIDFSDTIGYDTASAITSRCIHKGILVEDGEGGFKFSSPVMERFFIIKRLGYVERAKFHPSDLRELVFCAMKAIDYENIKRILGRMKTSADIGGLFGSRGFINFTIHLEGEYQPLWGFELLRKGDKLEEHIDRFASGGQYASLGLTDFCLIDFRKMDLTTEEKINADLALSEKLFIVCYDATLTNVILFNSQMAPKIIRSST